MTFQKLLPFLQCVECGANPLVFSADNHWICSSCGQIYVTHDGIPDLTSKQTMRMPQLYDDPDYLHWRKILASTQDYFYGTKGFISYVQNAGHRHIARLMHRKRYKVILDLGCGDGAHYPYIEHPEFYVGADIDQASLEKFRHRQPNSCVLRVDGYKLPFKNESIDALINIYNLEHMVYLDIVLEEMKRVLSSQGDVYISVPNEGGFLWGWGRTLTSVRYFKEINYQRIVAIEHINCIWQLEKAFKRYFKIVNKICFPSCLLGAHANLITTYHCVKL